MVSNIRRQVKLHFRPSNPKWHRVTFTAGFLQFMHQVRRFWLVGLMVFNATFNNIPVTPWRSVLLVEETGGPGENHRPVASHWQTLSHNVKHLALIEIRIHISGDVVIGTDCTGNKLNPTTIRSRPRRTPSKFVEHYAYIDQILFAARVYTFVSGSNLYSKMFAADMS